MMKTLIPPPVSAQCRPIGRMGRVLGFGLTPQTIWLLAAGTVWSIPEFYHPHRIWIMLAWDCGVLLLACIDVFTLPAPEKLTVTRRFLQALSLGERTEVEVSVLNNSNSLLNLRIIDELHPSIQPQARTVRSVAYPRDPAVVRFACYPGVRGDITLGRVFVRYTHLRFAERWVVCPLAQSVRVVPATENSTGGANLYLLRARQIEQQLRRVRQTGMGREFERLRDYQQGDELRNLSWTATARRGKLITREFTAERSQQVWVLIDAGRLSRTTFTMQRDGRSLSDIERSNVFSEEDMSNPGLSTLTITQLDQAASAAVMLARVVNAAGDKCAMLSYGRRLQQQLPPGAGPAHLRLMLELLSQTRSESAEADHLMAAARLKRLQSRRGMVLWITELADMQGQPEIAIAAANLARRHLVVLVLLHHREMNDLATAKPASVEQMYAITAANELVERRRSVVTSLRRQGVMVVEATPDQAGVAAINQYLEVKARGSL